MVIKIHKSIAVHASLKYVIGKMDDENNRIIIPDDNKLLTQLSTYECKISSSGNPVYNAPIGSHDDTVMSLCILVGTLYNEVELT